MGRARFDGEIVRQALRASLTYWIAALAIASSQ
jgi:hypothetical protein